MRLHQVDYGRFIGSKKVGFRDEYEDTARMSLRPALQSRELRSDDCCCPTTILRTAAKFARCSLRELRETFCEGCYRRVRWSESREMIEDGCGPGPPSGKRHRARQRR